MKGSRRFFLVVFLLIGIFIPSIFADTPTLLNVPNTPPELIGLIPNQSWPGGLKSDAFNLNDYFVDIQGDPMNFSYTPVTGITISIDSNGFVSFDAITGLIGDFIIHFNATDGENYGDSNPIHLFVGIDNEPPQWSDVQKDKQYIYQNDYVQFSAHWTDNFQLSNYSLFLDQGDGFVLDPRNFSGVSADSVNTVQISAPQNKIVYWKICAEDTSQNMNCTDTKQFTVSIRQVPPDGDSSSSSSSSGTGTGSGSGSMKKIYYQIKDKLLGETSENYTISVDSFLVSLKQGNYKTLVFEIINHGTEELSFSLSIDNLDGLVIVSEKEFLLSSGASKSISIDFRSNLTTTPGEYLGVLLIDSIYDRRIPITYQITKADLDFEISVNVLEEYKSVNPGEEIIANVSLVNLKDRIQSEVLLYYAIKDFYGKIYYSEEENIIFDNFLEFNKELIVPEDVPIGRYIFYVRASNEKDFDVGVDDFMVGSTFRFQSFLKSSFAFLFILILSTILFLLFLKYKRQKERERALNLYVKLIEMKNLLEEKKFDAATNIYISIKNIYGEPLDEEILKNKSELVKEMKRLSNNINFEEIQEEVKKEIKEEIKEDTMGGEKSSSQILDLEEKKIEKEEQKIEKSSEVKDVSKNVKKEVEVIEPIIKEEQKKLSFKEKRLEKKIEQKTSEKVEEKVVQFLKTNPSPKKKSQAYEEMKEKLNKKLDEEKNEK